VPPSGAHDATLGLPPRSGLWPPLLGVAMLLRCAEPRENLGTATHLGSRSLSSDRCFCSACRELIWSQQRPRTSAFVSRCAGTTARTCAPGSPPSTVSRVGKLVSGPQSTSSFGRRGCTWFPLRRPSPLRGTSLSRESSRRAPAVFATDPPSPLSQPRRSRLQARGEETERVASSAASRRSRGSFV